MKVKAFDSTDEGLSYLVEMDGIRIFHAGDLNNWHWREESTPREIEEAERDFQQVMETMRGEKVDVAFFPVDPRLGMMFDAGPNYFAMVVKPRLMIPMHFWERAEVIREYARRSRSPQTEIIAMTTPGDMILLEFDEQENMTVHMQSVTSAPVARTRRCSWKHTTARIRLTILTCRWIWSDFPVERADRRAFRGIIEERRAQSCAGKGSSTHD